MLRFLSSAYKAYTSFRPFSEQEAWVLFRVAAIAEAVGWTLLIIGIGCTYLPVTWHEVPVQIAGRLHGALFLIYVAGVLLLAPSLHWHWLRTIVAGLFSTPPYGTLFYEKISAFHLDLVGFNRIRAVTLLNNDLAKQSTVSLS